jgi:hypothetical protein
MALVLADRVRETTTVTGTGTATLLGAVSGYQSFAAVGNANTTYYVIANQSASEWEVGIGTYTASGTTLSRDTVLSSSNSGSLVNFSAGTKDVFVDYPAGRAVYEDAAGNVDGYPITGGTINNTVIGGTTPAAGTFTTLTATGQTSLGGVAGAEGLRVVPVASSTRYLTAQGSTADEVYLTASGPSGSNVALALSSRATGAVRFYTNTANQEQMRVSHTASAVNYVQVTGAATTSFPVISSQGSDTNIGLTFASKGTSAIRFNTNSADQQFRISNTTGSDSYIEVKGGSSATGGAYITAAGTARNLYISSGVANPIRFFTGGEGTTEQARIAHTASAVNFVQVTGAATGNPGVCFISAQGSDTNISLAFVNKGTGAFSWFNGATTGSRLFRVNGGATNMANHLQIDAAAAGSAPTLSVGSLSSDTNVDLALTPKGTGNVRFGTYTGTISAITGYIEIKDSGGTVRRLAVVA